MAWELSFLDALQGLRTPFLDFFFKYITMLGDGGIFCILLGLALLIPKKTRVCGVCVLGCLIFDALVCNVTLKPLVARQRPCWVNTAIQTIVASPSDFSFPSGHSAACFVTATAIYMNNRKWGIVSLITAALVAFSRLYLYMHWPTDVLAGILIGVVLGIAVSRIILKNCHKVSFLSK